MPSYDLALCGGRLLDPASGLDADGDVAVAGGRVAEIGTGLAARSTRAIDCRGQIVAPGLIDSHTHVFELVSKVGARADEAHLRRGVVAAVDAGTAGASTFAAFKRLVVEPSRCRVLAFLNVSVLGLIDFRFGELLNASTLVPEDAAALAAAHPEVVRGFKIRLSDDVVGHDGALCLELLARSVELASSCGLPLMVHIGETPASLDDILEVLRPGDLVAHCYTGKQEGILDQDKKLRASVVSARERGVLFESAHGKSNFSYEVAQEAIGQGFLPDLVCSDTSGRNWNGPVFDLLTTISKLVTLGMDLEDTLERATTAPARVLGLAAEGYGRLELGAPAHVSVLRRLDEPDELPDAAGGRRLVRRFEPSLALLGGEVVEPLPWRGRVPAAP